MHILPWVSKTAYKEGVASNIRHNETSIVRLIELFSEMIHRINTEECLNIL